MALLFVILVVALAATIGVGTLAHRRSWSLAGGPDSWGRAAAERFGAVPGALLVLVPGCIVVFVVGLGLGYLAKGTQSGFDRPIFDWINPRVDDGLFTRLMSKFTQMGNNPITEVLCTVSVIILACAYKRRWWLPTIAIIVAFVDQKIIWKVLGKIIHREHPIAGFGSYPSGGVGRLVSIYGVILLLVIMLIPTLSRAWKAGLWTGLAAAGVLESFTRIYLSKHWTTDAVFALPLATLLLLVNIAAVVALARLGTAPRTTTPPQESEQAAASALR